MVISNEIRSGGSMCLLYSASRRPLNNMTVLGALSLSGQPPLPALHLIISGHDWPCSGLCATTDPASIVSSLCRAWQMQAWAGWRGTYAACLWGHLDINIHSLLSLLHHFTPTPAFPSSLSSFLLLWSPPLLPSSCFLSFLSVSVPQNPFLITQAFQLMSPAVQNTHTIQTAWREIEMWKAEIKVFYFTPWESALVVCVFSFELWENQPTRKHNSSLDVSEWGMVQQSRSSR